MWRRKREQWVTLQADVLEETDRAIKFYNRLTGYAVYIPKCQLRYLDDEGIQVPYWLAEKIGHT